MTTNIFHTIRAKPVTIRELIKRKSDLRYSNDLIAKLSGVSISTVQKIMSGVTRNPRKETRQALEAVLGEATYARKAEELQEKDL
ncbi:MAG: helix-turn-helix domain-containing protein [Blautia sp.]|nr:helix-turn-helix domain-containing protein [Blautia sp.]